MRFEDLPLEEQRKLRKAFENHPEIIKLNNTAIYFRRNNRYIESLKTFQEIEKQWEYIKQQHCQSYDKVVEETVKLSELNLPDTVLQPFLENIILIFMCCCLIENAHYDANEILKKFNKDYSVDNFQDLVDLINNVHKKIKYLYDETGYMDDSYWYDSCDKFHDMMINKARSIIKKKDAVDRWGKNFKKYIDGTLDKK